MGSLWQQAAPGLSEEDRAVPRTTLAEVADWISDLEAGISGKACPLPRALPKAEEAPDFAAMLHKAEKEMGIEPSQDLLFSLKNSSRYDPDSPLQQTSKQQPATDLFDAASSTDLPPIADSLLADFPERKIERELPQEENALPAPHTSQTEAREEALSPALSLLKAEEKADSTGAQDSDLHTTLKNTLAAAKKYLDQRKAAQAELSLPHSPLSTSDNTREDLALFQETQEAQETDKRQFASNPPPHSLPQSLDIFPDFSGCRALPPLPTHGGEILAVCGSLEHLGAISQTLAERIGLTSEGVRLASPSPDHTLLSGYISFHDPDTAQSRRRAWRRRENPIVVALASESESAEQKRGEAASSWTRQVLAALEPAFVIGIVSACASPAETRRWIGMLGGVDALAFVDMQHAPNPASVLQFDLPIMFLDGHDATPEHWARLLAKSVI